MTILVKFSHISTILHKLKDKIGTLKKKRLLTLVVKLHFLLKLVLQKCCYPKPEPGAGARSRNRLRLDRLHNTGREYRFLRY